jgi:hypothetical protein
MGRLKERKIIATLAAFVGSGVVIINEKSQTRMGEF